MTSEDLWEMFEGDFADTCAEKLPRAEGLACADPGMTTHIGVSGISLLSLFPSFLLFSQKEMW
jgi:hypothetical protein